MCTLCQEETQLNTMSIFSDTEKPSAAALKPAQGPSDELKSQHNNEDINNIILSDLDIGQYLGYIGAKRANMSKDPILIDEIVLTESQISHSVHSENCHDHLSSCSTCSHEV